VSESGIRGLHPPPSPVRAHVQVGKDHLADLKFTATKYFGDFFFHYCWHCSGQSIGRAPDILQYHISMSPCTLKAYPY
jgi:hypothetical protein